MLVLPLVDIEFTFLREQKILRMFGEYMVAGRHIHERFIELRVCYVIAAVHVNPVIFLSKTMAPQSMVCSFRVL